MASIRFVMHLISSAYGQQQMCCAKYIDSIKIVAVNVSGWTRLDAVVQLVLSTFRERNDQQTKAFAEGFVWSRYS